MQLDPRGVNQLVAVLDPGLELIGVSGPDVKSFQTRPEDAATRVVVTFSGSAVTTTKVEFEAQTRVPLEGRWRVPAMRPMGAVWTGGTTTISLDDSRTVRDCVERSGRRLLTESGGIRDGTRIDSRLVFEARSPDSVAELILGRPQVPDSCSVRGLLIVGSSAPRLECQLTGLGARGSSSELEIELPPTWVPNRVQWGGVEESLGWQATVGADGSTRLRVLLPDAEGTTENRRLVVCAVSTVAGGRGPLFLPRVRPAKITVANEVWVAKADSDMTLNPITARGLVWLDPGRLEDMVPVSRLESPGQRTRPGLALEWRECRGEGRPGTGGRRAQGGDPIPRERGSHRLAPGHRGSDHRQLGGRTPLEPADLDQRPGGRAERLVVQGRGRRGRNYPGRELDLDGTCPARISRDRHGLGTGHRPSPLGPECRPVQGSCTMEI